MIHQKTGQGIERMSKSESQSQNIAHKSVTTLQKSAIGPSTPINSTPSTPSRNLASPYGSPSTLRAEEDLVVIEIGNRCVRVGFAGDAAPRGYLHVGPANQRREGDFRPWQVPSQPSYQRPCRGRDWSREHELWRDDLREVDLRLFEDRLERLLLIAFNRLVLNQETYNSVVILH